MPGLPTPLTEQPSIDVPSCASDRAVGHDINSELDRRRFLGVASVAGLTGVINFANPGHAAIYPQSQDRENKLGLVIYCRRFRREWDQRTNRDHDLYQPQAFLQHCVDLGAGGMQARLGVLSSDAIDSLRALADRHELFIDAIVSPPRNDSDVSRFEAEVESAAIVGVNAIRTVIMPGRRYEQFQSLEEFQSAADQGRRMLELAAPVVEKHRVRLAVENHKDQRIDERVALLRHIDSEYVGVCLDTGNSMALLDDPYEAVSALAPFTATVHLKDQAVQECEQGFLLGDVPLGQGCLDLPRIVRIIETSRPGSRYALELITRDALVVPCLTEEYWATMPSVPGRDLARAMQLVRDRSADALQEVSSLSLEEQVELEETNVASSLIYAREHLGL